MRRDVVLRGELLRSGYAPDEVRRRLRTGELAAVRRGAYVLGNDPRLAEQMGAHRLAIEAAVCQLGPGTVVSHASAAILYGFPVWGLSLERVHVTRDRPSGARLDRLVHMHAARLDPDEVTAVDGILVTALSRTVVDVARSAPFEAAVSLADAALAGSLVTRAELAAAADRAVRRPGTPAARRVIAFADGRSESVGESRSRVAIAAAGLPAPILQWEVRNAEGTFLGRVDFGRPALRTVGEFDGRVKYGRLLRPGEEPGDVVWREKRREDALRAESLGVTRWGWADIPTFTARLARALDRSPPRPEG